jgi:hypothetical protein
MADRSQSDRGATSTSDQSDANNQQRSTAQKQEWETFSIEGKNVSFDHPPSWQCETEGVHIDHPEWLETSCASTKNEQTNTNLVIHTPYVDSGTTKTLQRIEQSTTSLSGFQMEKVVYQGRASDAYKGVMYIHGESEESGSFRFWFPLRTDEGQSVSSVEETANKILQSLSRNGTTQ